MPRIVPATEPFIHEAAARLRSGGVVVFPTETVYGLGASTFDIAALDSIYQLKGRPANNPLIAHVLGAQQVRALATNWDSRCDQLAARFWPGPLTLVLTKIDSVPDQATAGLKTIAVRAPAHAAARRLLELFGGPISAPSANRSGRVSPTTARHVAADFADVDDLLILDGGPCQVGIESTVLDLTGTLPRILRPGAITADQLRTMLGTIDDQSIVSQSSSPGTSPAHYSPRTPAQLVESSRLQLRLNETRQAMAVLCFEGLHINPPHRAIVMPRSADQYAHKLYSALRQADAFGCAMILIEQPPASSDLWRAVHDRLQRATGSQETL